MRATETAAAEIVDNFAALGYSVSLHVRELSSGAEFALDADRPMVMASIFKPVVALELFAQIAEGTLDPSQRIRSQPDRRVPGPTGLSNFRDEVELSLRDLAQLMVTISDNEATDLLLAQVGLAQVNARLFAMGCTTTLLRSSIGDMLDELARELGFASYAELLAAQAGQFGLDAQLRSTDQLRIDACAALDPTRGSVTTARDMTTALTAIWRDTAAPVTACREVRSLMAAQVTRRLEAAAPAGGTLAAKSGGLFGRVRNEIAVICHPDGAAYAAAIFTRTNSGFGASAAIDRAMGESVGRAIAALCT